MLQEEALHQEALHQEALHQEALHQEALHQEALHQEALHQEALAERAALRLIARAEQCSLGLARKLEKRKFPELCINTVISRLIELKLIDDIRFASLWLESQMHLTRSPRRLLASLYRRGVEMENAQTALKTVLDEETEFALLARFAEKRLRKALLRGEKEKASLKYLLKIEGFSPQIIKRFLSEE